MLRRQAHPILLTGSALVAPAVSRKNLLTTPDVSINLQVNPVRVTRDEFLHSQEEYAMAKKRRKAAKKAAKKASR
jgi:hypothetical protein